MNAIFNFLRVLSLLIFTVALLFPIGTSSAATFELKAEKQGDYELDIIYVSGRIEAGDEKKFLELAMKAKPDALVWLDSPGGDLQPALQIGQLISMREFSTGVNGVDCASACGLIWLAGKFRFLNNGGRIGFHSPYIVNESTGKPEVDSVASALVGSYVRKLELPSSIAALVVEAPPDQISWVTLANAGSFGLIAYRFADFNALELHNKAFEASENGRFDEALQFYREAARAGYAGSQNNLGDMYERGEGLPGKSDVLAVYWYTRAAERGEPFGYWSLASVLSRSAEDIAGKIEATMFALLAAEKLPAGPDRDAARKLVSKLRSKISRGDFDLAIQAAKRWEPLIDDEFKMGADEEV